MAVLIISIAALGCSGGDDSAAPTTCPANQPVQCNGANGSVLGCCPLDHPVCSADGKQCLEATGGSGGSSGSASGGGGAGGSGATGNGGGSGGTGANAGSGGQGGSGGVGGSTGGTGGTGGAVSCVDVGFEPNESEATAVDIGSVTDCDGTGSSLSAKLDDAGDVDFYVFFGSDVAGCTVDAHASTADNVRICLFADCDGVSASCTAGTSSSLGGLPGCCASGGGAVTVDVDCSGLSDNAAMYLRVDQGAAGQCTDYTIDWHY